MAAQCNVAYLADRNKGLEHMGVLSDALLYLAQLDTIPSDFDLRVDAPNKVNVARRQHSDQVARAVHLACSG
jgi:hypothetical protein